MDVKLLFTAVDNNGALASAASDKLEGVVHVIVLGPKAWMFSAEDINKTVVLQVSNYADDRADHEALSKAEDAAWAQIQEAVRDYATALIEAQMERLKMVNQDEERAHQRLAAEEKNKLEQYMRKTSEEPEILLRTSAPQQEMEAMDKAKAAAQEEESLAADEADADADLDEDEEPDPTKMNLPTGQELMDDVTKLPEQEEHPGPASEDEATSTAPVGKPKRARKK